MKLRKLYSNGDLLGTTPSLIRSPRRGPVRVLTYCLFGFLLVDYYYLSNQEVYPW